MRARLFLSALAVVLGAGLFVAAPSGIASANYGQVHCVRHGETLSGIAARYGTSVWAIANANGIGNPNWIRAGQCLTIPGGGGGGYYGGHNTYKPTPYYGGYNTYYPKQQPYYGGYYNYWYNQPYYGGYNSGYYGGYYGKKW